MSEFENSNSKEKQNKVIKMKQLDNIFKKYEIKGMHFANLIAFIYFYNNRSNLIMKFSKYLLNLTIYLFPELFISVLFTNEI